MKKPDKVALVDAFVRNVICSPDLFLSRFWRPMWSSMCQCQVKQSPRPLSRMRFPFLGVQRRVL